MSDDQWGAGDRSNWSNHGFVMVGAERRPLIYGEHPHSRSDNRHYVEMDGEAVGFDGHRILIGVEITASNYLKGSHYSGSEVRKGGSGKITADGEVVFEFFTRDTRGALLRAHHLIGELSEHSSGWLSKEARDRLVGRKVYYRGVPAVITRLIVDQGCVILETEDGKPFPPPVYRDAEDEDERESSIKDEVLSPHIWWHRS